MGTDFWPPLYIQYIYMYNVYRGGSTLKKLNSKIEILEFNINYFNFFNIN